MTSPRPSLKAQWENHPVVFMVGLCVTAFVTGIAFQTWLNSYFGPTSETGNVLDVKPATRDVICTVEGLEAVESGHQERIKLLIGQLTKQESQATNPSLMSTYRIEARASADRIRSDIKSENLDYKSALDSLTKKCE